MKGGSTRLNVLHRRNGTRHRPNRPDQRRHAKIVGYSLSGQPAASAGASSSAGPFQWLEVEGDEHG